MGMQKAPTDSYHDRTKKEKCVESDRIHGQMVLLRGGTLAALWGYKETQEEKCYLPSPSTHQRLYQIFSNSCLHPQSHMVSLQVK